ncbi:MAG TPA: hypothetical protein VFZ85_15500 [Jiangellaceae bacterium]
MDWHERWPEGRPRWGTYSVKAHQELDRLITDILIYDVLVFPCPDDDAEFDRWQREGWDPALLARRVTQLGDHAVVTPWDPALREGWQQNWWSLPAEDREDPEAPFALTAVMMADLPLATLMGEEDDRFGRMVLEQPRVHPAYEGFEGWSRARQEALELVAAFQTQRDAWAITGSGGRHRLPTQALPGADGDGIRLRLQLQTLAGATEDTFLRAIDLVQDEDFQRARHRLWSWEQTLPPDSSPREVTAGLEALVADYNAAVRRQHAETKATWAFLIVPALVGAALDAVTAGVAGVATGIGASIVFDRVKARFPILNGKAARASHHPGSAVDGMLAIAGPAAPPT